MDVETSILSQQVSNEDEALIHHREVGVVTGSPRVSIRVFFEDRRLLDEPRVPDPDLDREVIACRERWVDVDEVDLARKTLQEAAHYELVVAPDELVSPAARAFTVAASS